MLHLITSGAGVAGGAAEISGMASSSRRPSPLPTMPSSVIRSCRCGWRFTLLAAMFIFRDVLDRIASKAPFRIRGRMKPASFSSTCC